MQHVLAIAFCLAGAALAVGGLLPLLRSHATRRWPRTDGTIVSCDVTWSDVVGGAGDAVEVMRMGHVDVVYEYVVDGIARRGTRIRVFDPKRLHAKECDALAARFARGARVDVFHHPADPARTVLDRSSGFVFVGTVFLLLGAGLLAGGIALAVLR